MSFLGGGLLATLFFHGLLILDPRMKAAKLKELLDCGSRSIATVNESGFPLQTAVIPAVIVFAMLFMNEHT